jgi:branched-chain amino acid transport system permease protein
MVGMPDLSHVMSFAQLGNALALASLLAILSSGLALIFGLRDVMNFGHGALYMLGAYIGYSASSFVGFWGALLLVPILLAAVGAALELAVLRPLQGRSHMDVALITFGLGLILASGIAFFWGKLQLDVRAPIGLDGTVGIFGESYPTYRLFLIAIGFGACGALAIWLRYTRPGMYTRAASQQPEVARMMGVNTDRLSLLVVCLGSAYAGLAGVVAGPYLAVELGMGHAILLSTLIVVVVGGLGSIGGAIAAALLYGFVQVIGAVLVPAAAAVVPYLLLGGVLLWRPQGLGRGRLA